MAHGSGRRKTPASTGEVVFGIIGEHREGGMKPTLGQINYAIWVAKEHFERKCVISGEAHLSLCALNGSHIIPRAEPRLAANPHNIVPISAIEDQHFERVSPGKRIAYLLDRVAKYNPDGLDKVLAWVALLRIDAGKIPLAVEY